MIRWKLRLTRVAQPTLRGALTLTLTLTRVATDDGADEVACRPTYDTTHVLGLYSILRQAINTGMVADGIEVVVATTAPPQYHSLPRYHHLNYLMQWRDEGLIHKSR